MTHDEAILYLAQRLRDAKSVTEIARQTARILQLSGIHNFQAVGHELMRISATQDGGE
jgi:hypothetical protein